MPAEVIIGILNYGLILIFGLCLSVEIAGGCESRRQRRTVALLCVLLLLIQISPWLLFGVDTVKRLYPLIVHLPLTLGLIFLLHKPLGVSIVSVFTAYLCCEILNWVREIVSALTHSVLAGEISYAVLIVPVFLLLRRYFVRAAYEAMTCSRAALGLFGSLPVAFYFFDYATTIYSDALYAGIHAVNESLPALLIVFYVIFLTAYHVQTQRRGSAEMQSSMLEAKWSQAQTEMDAMRRSQAQTAVYQHDMRHHLNAIDAFLSADRTEQARDYIHRVQSEVEALSVRSYCENELVNLLCSSFAEKAHQHGIRLTAELRLPAALSIPDTEPFQTPSCAPFCPTDWKTRSTPCPGWTSSSGPSRCTAACGSISCCWKSRTRIRARLSCARGFRYPTARVTATAAAVCRPSPPAAAACSSCRLKTACSCCAWPFR